MTIRNIEQLLEHLHQGNELKYLFFWGHQNPKNKVTKACFSQWYTSPFTVNDIEYMTAEHYMMAEKARLFNDNQALQQVLDANNPGAAKQAGRSVHHFDESTWKQHCFGIVVQANTHKFGQNPDLKDFLLSTGERILVEASPVDRIWGIGLAEDNPKCQNPHQWKGLNLLGFALMEVRHQLSMKEE